MIEKDSRLKTQDPKPNRVLFTIIFFSIFTFPIFNLRAVPTDVTDLQAKENAPDVYLWWTAAVGSTGYKIWRGTFTGMISCAIPSTTFTTSNTFFSDTNALTDNNNYYYFVKAYDATPNESVNFSGLGFKICRAVTYRTTISNIIWWSIPYWYMSDIGGGNAQILANDMNGTLCTSGCSCTKVGRWTDNT